MKTMKTIKLILIAVLVSVGLNSCLLDQEGVADYTDTTNVVGFAEANKTLTFFVDNGDQSVNIPVRVDGPQKYDITNTITATVSVDPSSTAVEGEHFTIGDPTVTLTPEGNLLDVLDLTVLTDGIDPASMTENPVIILKLSNISDSSVLVNGRAETMRIEILYLCQSDMGGDYDNPDLPGGAAGVATLEVVGDGRYKVSALPYLGWGGYDPIYYYIIDNCNQLTYDSGELEENGYTVTAWFDRDEAAGTFTIYYSVLSFDFTNDPSTYTHQ